MNLAALGNAASLLAEAAPHEKSKTAFYIAGGALAGWAVLVGVFGFTHPDFPGSAGRARLVMAISLVLMLGAVSAAVLTGSTPPPAPHFVHVKLLPKGTAPPLTPVVASSAPAGGAAGASGTPASSSATPPAAAGAAGTAAPGAGAAAAGATRTAAPGAGGAAAATGAAGATAPAAAAPAGTLALAADPTGVLKFDQTTLSAKAGKVTIAFTNNSPVPHNVAIVQGSKTLGTTPTFAGGTKKLALTLPAGTYTFLCTVPGHAQAGMQGTLTVQ